MKKTTLLKRLTIPLVALSLLTTIGFYLAPDIRIDKILHQLELFRSKYTQQKVYVQTDKNSYAAGEYIWLKAYVINASDFSSDSISKEVYVDLIDYSNKQVHTEILRNTKGLAQGYLFLSDTLAEGNYQIRAYTNWMRNFDESYFFSKTISFKNPVYGKVITNHRLKMIKSYNRKFKSSESKRYVTFFPEGGQLVSDLKSVVAFKTENGAGYNLQAKGKLMDDKSNVLAEFETVHEGMGSFIFTPSFGKKYYALITFDGKKPQKFPMPEIIEKGTVINVDAFDAKSIRVTINSNRPESNDEYANDFIIVAQARGSAQYVSKVQWQGSPINVDISKSQFPTGIVQITVFDGRINPLCERLVFIQKPAAVNLVAKVNPIRNVLADSVSVEMVITDKDGNGIPANLSFAVTENTKSSQPDYSANILNQLYFASDLKGYVHNPGYYFDSSNPDAPKHLDLLLLTQGWRRFVWKEILANQMPEIRYAPSDGLAVGGIITRDFFGIPVRNTKIRMTVMSSYNDEYETYTDNSGRFNFPNLEYEDTISIQLQGYKPSGGKGVVVILTDTLVPDVKTPTLATYRSVEFSRKDLKRNNRNERLEFRKHFNPRKDPDIAVPKIHSTPNDVLYVGEDVSSYSNILSYMQGRVPGVQISGNSVVIRGVNSFLLSSDPLFLLDGVPIDAGAVTSINPRDIYVIEVLKGPEAAIYGSRGANGVIAFYSKRGHFIKRGRLDFGMQGYQRVKEFYVAPYEQFDYLMAEFDIPRTLYWKPMVKTDESGRAFLKFKVPFKLNNYKIVVEGLASNGELIRQVIRN